METQITNTLQPVLPIWAVIPGLIIIWIVTQWPQIREMLKEMVPSQRDFYREKQRLELLKLRYELEVLRKTNDLDSLEESTHGEETSPTAVGRHESDGQQTADHGSLREPFSFLDAARRIGFGAIGGFLTQLTVLIQKGEAASLFPITEGLERIFGYSFSPLNVMIVLTFLGGTAVYFLTNRATSGFHCFFLGFALLMVFLGFVPYHAPATLPSLAVPSVS